MSNFISQLMLVFAYHWGCRGVNPIGIPNRLVLEMRIKTRAHAGSTLNFNTNCSSSRADVHRVRFSSAGKRVPSVYIPTISTPQDPRAVPSWKHGESHRPICFIPADAIHNRPTSLHRPSFRSCGTDWPRKPPVGSVVRFKGNASDYQ